MPQTNPSCSSNLIVCFCVCYCGALLLLLTSLACVPQQLKFDVFETVDVEEGGERDDALSSEIPFALTFRKESSGVDQSVA
eukprot:3832568-Pleurochrysis_carterae.AAC.2